MSGRVVHFEIPADDVDRAEAFYREAFGWESNRMPELNYTMVTTAPSGETGPTEPGAINGGMLQRQQGMTSPVLVIEVDDIDAALTQVEKLGGSIVQTKMPIGDMGFAAYFIDTEGNTGGLWENKR